MFEWNPVLFNPSVPTPMAMSVMQSAEDADEFLKYFEVALNSGIGAAAAYDYAIKAADVNIYNLTKEDEERITRRVEAAAASTFNTEEE